jgi:polyhydroxyalkanoate synthesis regulator phasin
MLTIEAIQGGAMALPSQARESLAHDLLRSLEPQSEEWAGEIERRLTLIDDGEETPMTDEEFQSTIGPLREAIRAMNDVAGHLLFPRRQPRLPLGGAVLRPHQPAPRPTAHRRG